MFEQHAMPVRRSARTAATRDEINLATPIQLLNMLFARLMLDLERGRIALTERNYQEANNQLLHAQEILTELSTTLNLEGWGGAGNLYSIYQWCEKSVQRGNVNKNARYIEDAIRQLGPIQEAWMEVATSAEVAAMNVKA